MPGLGRAGGAVRVQADGQGVRAQVQKPPGPPAEVPQRARKPKAVGIQQVGRLHLAEVVWEIRRYGRDALLHGERLAKGPRGPQSP